jgi:hypothetical protein
MSLYKVLLTRFVGWTLAFLTYNEECLYTKFCWRGLWDELSHFLHTMRNVPVQSFVDTVCKMSHPLVTVSSPWNACTSHPDHWICSHRHDAWSCCKFVPFMFPVHRLYMLSKNKFMSTHTQTWRHCFVSLSSSWQCSWTVCLYYMFWHNYCQLG